MAFLLASGQLDSNVYVNVLQEENTRLKARVESLVQELTTLEDQRGGKSLFRLKEEEEAKFFLF